MKGKRKIGRFQVTNSGKKVVILYRGLSDIYREPVKGKKLGICASMEQEKAAWACDEFQVQLLRRYEAEFVIFEVRKLKLQWLGRAGDFFDPKMFYSRRKSPNGAYQRCVDMTRFKQASLTSSL